MATVHRLVSLLVAATCVLAARPAGATPLLVNADLSGGNSGFISNYLFSDIDCVPDHMYNVGQDPGACHGAWGHFGDHTTGTGLMLIVNGSATPETNLWSETVDVDQNTLYTLSGWVASSISANPAQLTFLIDGSPIGAPFNASSTVGLWQRFEATWQSGPATSVTLSLKDLNTEYGGNDFALDDFAVTAAPTDPVPEPATLTLLGIGFVTTAMTRRRRRS
jgi:hypothetical protein